MTTGTPIEMGPAGRSAAGKPAEPQATSWLINTIAMNCIRIDLLFILFSLFPALPD
jgi:hypothetical protein